MKRNTIIGAAIIVLAALAIWSVSKSPSVLGPADSSPSPSPEETEGPSPSPTDTQATWKWYQDTEYGFRIAYPADAFPFVNYDRLHLPLGQNEQVYQVFRQQGPHGWMFVGVIDRPVSLTDIQDGEPVRDVVTVNLSTGKGVRFVIGDGNCNATVFHAPLGQRILRVAFVACADTETDPIFRDYELQDRIMSTVELIN